MDRNPRRGARPLQELAPHAARPGLRAGARAGHAGTYLLQERERQPRRLAQAELGHCAGLLLSEGGRDEHHHRDGCRPMGRRDVVRRAGLRAGAGRLHGQGELQPEALPTLHHANVRRAGHRLAEHEHEGGAEDLDGSSDVSGQPWDGYLGGRRAGHADAKLQVCAGQCAQPCGAPPDGDRAGGGEADGDGWRVSGRGDRLLRRRIELLRTVVPLPAT